MGVEAAPPAQGSTHAPISAGETADRVPGTLRPDAEPPVGEVWEAAPNSATSLRASASCRGDRAGGAAALWRVRPCSQVRWTAARRGGRLRGACCGRLQGRCFGGSGGPVSAAGKRGAARGGASQGRQLLGPGAVCRPPRLEWPPRRRSRPVVPAHSACFPSMMASEAMSPRWRVGASSGAAGPPERILRGNSGCVPSTHPHCQLFQHGGHVTEQLGQRVAARGDMSIWWGLGRYAPEGTPDDPDRPGASEHRPAPQTWALYPPGVGW